MRRWLLVGLLGFAAVVCGGYFLVGVAADYMATHVSDATEAEMFGNLGARQQGWRDTPENASERRVLAIFDQLRQASGLRGLDYRLYFTGDAAPNAFALPGGALGVTKGMVDMVQGDVGLATVLGHEFGHQQHRDSLKLLGRSLMLATVASVMLGGDNSVLVNLALDLAEKSHSRHQELDADAYGLRLVKRVFGTTKGALEFFTKVEKDPKMQSTRLLSMFSTHPYTPERIARLRKLAASLDR